MSATTTQGSSPTDATFGELYRGLARRLEQIVRAEVRASETVVEDACQFAWGSLLAHASGIRSEAALSWLATTAIREAWRLIHARERDLPLEPDDTDEVDTAGPSAPDATDALAEDRERLRLMRLLPERQQRMLWLHALGLSYQEIAAYTGDTTRTVERQLLRGRARIRALAV
jgi:RNA polymerase sigma factor (sigma-70 family)